MSDLFLNILLYIFEAKKRCLKKSLNKLTLAADSLKLFFYISMGEVNYRTIAAFIIWNQFVSFLSY